MLIVDALAVMNGGELCRSGADATATEFPAKQT